MIDKKTNLALSKVVSDLRQVLQEDLSPGVRTVLENSVASITKCCGSLPEQISDHFTLVEFLTSPTAVKHGLTLSPTGPVYANICNLVNRVLEPARRELGKPIYISSGYRSQALNRLVGGVPTSYHLQGRAADISTAQGFHSTLFNILSELPHVELIDYKTFIHVAL